jgi:hypothetical protein
MCKVVVAKRRVVDPRRRDLRQEESGSPLALDPPVEFVEPFRASSPRIVLMPRGRCVRRVEHEGSCSLGMGGGEQERDGPGLREPEERGRTGACGVQNAEEVVHLLFHGRVSLGSIGESRPSWIDHDQAGERRQAPQECREARLLPIVVEVREQPRDEDEVDRSAADHLVGDVDIAALRVMNLWGVHGPSLSGPANRSAIAHALGTAQVPH